MKLFKKILIANRGEIAVRVIRSARKLGIRTVAIYSTADSGSLHVKMADEAFCLGSDELHESYLDIPKIIEIAKSSGSEAIHPGYGFLSENPEFVKACDKAGIVFIGPHAEAIRLMGNKVESREFVKNVGIPMTEGITGDIKTLEKRAGEIPFPILVKAAAGGGGKGMRIVYEESKLAEVLETTTREAKSYFGDGTVFIEKFIEEPRHIEIQVLGDNHGNAIHLYERECSIQRRYQKIIEESPSPTLTQEVREKMGEAAADIARKIKYNNAGTVEFLVDKDLNFYFLEMNTRVQVEHPVTELVTGIDIVKEQILIAAGKELDIRQEEVKQNGHAIECRIYAEDPENNFMPSPGKMTLYREPEGDHIRLDTGIEKACTIESFYDPMISKLIIWGETREVAREKMISALNNYVVHGIRTNIAYLREMLQHPAYINNTISTKYCDEHTDDLIANIRKEKDKTPTYLPAIAAYIYDFNKWKVKGQGQDPGVWKMIGHWRDVMELSIEVDGKELAIEIEKIRGNAYFFKAGDKSLVAKLKSIGEGRISFTIGRQQHDFFISSDGKGNIFASNEMFSFEMIRHDVLVSHEEILGSFDAAGGGNDILSPMPGKVIKVHVKEGDSVAKGQTLIIVEAMKMENHLVAPFDAVIGKVVVKQNDKVDGNARLIELQKVE